MRLIDADKLIEHLKATYNHEKDVINSYWLLNTLIDKVDEVPTAYDVDKVVEQLEKKIQTHTRCIEYEKKNGMITEEFQQRKAVEVLKDAIEIVKGGGV
jgi:hypothetical protein